MMVSWWLLFSNGWPLFRLKTAAETATFSNTESTIAESAVDTLKEWKGDKGGPSSLVPCHKLVAFVNRILLLTAKHHQCHCCQHYCYHLQLILQGV
mmetsp:Transcript_88751/g.148101  ORF Transcript_88751/g.148101 Transcript_88751/m.148101 type:complete len:96 (+) Transcript_88751:103-390(+)